MISATQREGIEVLRELCAMSDDIRLGQLLAHLGFLGEINTGRTLWDIEDEQLLAVLYQHRAELAARLSDSPGQAPQLAGLGAPVGQHQAPATPVQSETP